jgi:glutaredoxin
MSEDEISGNESEPAQETEEKPKDFSPSHNAKKRKIPWKPAAGFAAVAILFFAVGFFAKGGSPVTGQAIQGAADKNTVANDVLGLINENIKLQGGTGNATLVSVGEESGLYKITLSIDGKDTPFYSTTDGTYYVQAYKISDIKQQMASASQQQPSQTTTVPKTDKPNVKMFVMAYCPYGQQAEAGLGPALETIGLNNVTFEPHFVIYSNYQGGGPNYCFDNASLYCSMHGINEIREDIRQMVIWKYWPDKWWAYVNKVDAETSTSTIESKWKDIATSVGLNPTEIQQKFDSEALTLLANEASLNAKYSVQGSPTIFINDVSYSGGRTPDAFKSGICGAYNTPPAGCGQTLNSTATTAASGGCAA